MNTLASLSMVGFLLGAVRCSSWGYGVGGADWDGICATEFSQSPVNIPFSDPSYLTQERGSFLRIDFDFDSSDDLQVFNNGHNIVITSNSTPTTIQIPIVDGLLHGIIGGGAKTPANTEYVTATFVNFHMHDPSEHTYDGFIAPMEAHMVMQISKEDLPSCPMDACYSVVGFRFKYTPENTENPFLAALLESIGGEWPSSEEELPMPVSFALDFEDLLPSESPSYVVYNGSLTTPPCTEYVLWHVLEKPLPVSVEQVTSVERAVSKVMHGTSRNSRTIQPLNGRTLGYVASELQM